MMDGATVQQFQSHELMGTFPIGGETIPGAPNHTIAWRPLSGPVNRAAPTAAVQLDEFQKRRAQDVAQRNLNHSPFARRGRMSNRYDVLRQAHQREPSAAFAPSAARATATPAANIARMARAGMGGRSRAVGLYRTALAAKPIMQSPKPQVTARTALQPQTPQNKFIALGVDNPLIMRARRAGLRLDSVGPSPVGMIASAIGATANALKHLETGSPSARRPSPLSSRARRPNLRNAPGAGFFPTLAAG
jgi:hypothetical protein